MQLSSENFRLDREITAAKLLRVSLSDILDGDDQLAVDTIAGSTNLNEAIEAAVALFCEDKVYKEALEAHIALLESRRARIEKRMGITRELVCVALDQAGRKSIDTPLGTASLSPTPPALITDPDTEHNIPTKFWKRGDAKLDRKAVKAALEKGETVTGASLSNGGQTVRFTFR